MGTISAGYSTLPSKGMSMYLCSEIGTVSECKCLRLEENEKIPCISVGGSIWCHLSSKTSSLLAFEATALF